MMRSTRRFVAGLVAALMLLASCGGASVTAGGAQSLGEPPPSQPVTPGEFEALSSGGLQVEVASSGACPSFEATSIHVQPPEDYLSELVPRLDWAIAIGPFDVQDRSGGDPTKLFRTTSFDLDILDGDPRGLGIVEVLAGSSTQRSSFEVTNVSAGNWPDGGVVLVGSDGGRVDFAISVLDDGIAAIGYCLSGFSTEWNAHVATLGLESHVEALDILLADALDERLAEVLRPEEIEEPVVVEWVDRAPNNRTYDGAPDDVRQRLGTSSVVVYVPLAWQARQGGICSRTPEALHECVGFSAVQTLSNGEPGWIQRVFVAPELPVTLFLVDSEGATTDLVELSVEVLESAGAETSIFVDIRTTSAQVPDSLTGDSDLVQLIEVGLTPTPRRPITPLSEDDGP